MSLLSPSCSSPWDTSHKVQIPILLHADTFNTNQYCKHYVSVGANCFFTTKGNTDRQYVLERLFIYIGFVNDTDLLKYNCSICFFQPDCLWTGLGPALVIYCRHANYITFIISRNYSSKRLFPFIAFICIKILFAIKQNGVILKIVKYVLSLANLAVLSFSAINIKGYVYWLCFLEVSALVPEIKSPSANGHAHLVTESNRATFLLLLLPFRNANLFQGR